MTNSENMLFLTNEENLFFYIFYEKKKLSGIEKKILKAFLNNISCYGGTPAIRSTAAFLTLYEKNLDKIHSYPKLPFPAPELFIILAAQNHPILSSYPKNILNKAVKHILSNEVLTVRLFQETALHVEGKTKLATPTWNKLNFYLQSKQGPIKYITGFFIKAISLGTITTAFYTNYIYPITHTILKTLLNLSKLQKVLVLTTAISTAAFVTIQKAMIKEDSINKTQSAFTVDTQTEQNIQLAWKFYKNMSVNINKNGTVKSYNNKQHIHTRREHNLINFVVEKIKNRNAQCSGHFKSLAYSENFPVPTLLLKDTSQFLLKRNGTFHVPGYYTYPNIRNIPAFPEYLVAPGSNWIANCEIFYHQSSPSFTVITEAHYHYMENVFMDERHLAKISISFTVKEDIQRQLKTKAPFELNRLYATNYSILYWDIEQGHPYIIKESFKERAWYNDGRTKGYVMNFNNSYDITYPISKTKQKTIISELNKASAAGPEIIKSIDKTAMRFFLAETFFNNDNAALNKTGKNALEKILPIIDSVPGYEIAVYGKTAEGSNSELMKSLALDRAISTGTRLSTLTKGKKRKIYITEIMHSDKLSQNTPDTETGVEIIIRQGGK
jgi:hypothetical protein